EEPPAEANVCIATVDQISRFRQAWDYRRLCARAGLNPQKTYISWLRHGLIPDLAWRKWLFGDRRPEGAFIVEPALQRVRREKFTDRICKAAGVCESAVWRWKKNSQTAEALKEAIRVAGAVGGRTIDSLSSDAWSRLPTRTKDRMWAYAQAATLS